MFDIGWSELAIIAVIALVVLGPKELASTMRTLGQWAGRARALAQEFRRGLDDLARESEIDSVKKQLDSVRSFDLGRHIDAATETPPPPPRAASESAPDPAIAGGAAETPPTSADEPKRAS